MPHLTLSSPTPNLVPACDTEGDRRQQRADRLQALRDEEYESMRMPPDYVMFMAERIEPMDEARVWNAIRTGDAIELMRILTPYSDEVRSEAADKRAERRMQALDRGDAGMSDTVNLWGKPYKETDERRGLSSGCTLEPLLVMAILMGGREHPCDRCNMDRSVCRGYPPKD